MNSSSLAALVLCGGDIGDVIPSSLPPAEFVVAADGGIAHAGRLGVRVDVVIGDMDSATPHELEKAKADGVSVITYPPDKDASDLELAIDTAVERGATSITVVTSAAGRFDHVMGNMLALTRPSVAHVQMRAIVGPARVYVVRDEIELHGGPGKIVSQFPVNGPVHGLTLEGSAWAGRYETVSEGSSLCLHDEFTDEPFRLTIESGTMLVIVPGE